MDKDARIEAEQVKERWLPYPEMSPVQGWCATTDGGDIALTFWSNGGWLEGDRGIVEFMQVTVN